MDLTPEKIQELRNENGGSLPAFAWPGGYTIVYYDADNEVLCATCANKGEEYSSPVVACDLYDEGPNLYCCDCSTTMRSSYGDPENEK